MPITTVTNCRAFREVESGNTEHDAELARLIIGVQAFLEQECGRVFEQGTVTEYFNGDDWRDTLVVSRPPIVSITNIWDDPSRIYATPIAATLYGIGDADAGTIELLDGLVFNSGRRNIKVTYSGGFSSIPADLEQAAIEMVWAAREKGQHNLIGVRSRSIADSNIQFVNLDWGAQGWEPIIRKYSLKTGVS